MNPRIGDPRVATHFIDAGASRSCCRDFTRSRFHTVHGSRRGVIYAYDGRMLGGNSAFAFIGTLR